MLIAVLIWFNCGQYLTSPKGAPRVPVNLTMLVIIHFAIHVFLHSKLFLITCHKVFKKKTTFKYYIYTVEVIHQND